MSISRIPNPDFVVCGDCGFRSLRKTYVMNKGPQRIPFCIRVLPYRQLRGRKGCDEGVKKK